MNDDLDRHSHIRFVRHIAILQRDIYRNLDRSEEDDEMIYLIVWLVGVPVMFLCFQISLLLTQKRVDDEDTGYNVAAAFLWPIVFPLLMILGFFLVLRRIAEWTAEGIMVVPNMIRDLIKQYRS